MTVDQLFLFLILGSVFGLLVWGRWRYDFIAFSALILAAGLGIVESDQVFSGFAHPAVLIVALVLLASRGLSGSGAVEFIAHYLIRTGRSITAHIAVMSGFAAILSATMNNVAALALLMPLDIQAAEREKRSPASTLIPLSFASILGGMITLIGTPSNVVVAIFREKTTGESFSMFDFTPVGLAVATAGILYVATVGRHLIPVSRTEHNSSQELSDLTGFVAEACVTKKSAAVGKKVHELYELASEHDVNIIGLVRGEKRMPGYAYNTQIEEGDRLILEATTPSIERFIGAANFEFGEKEQKMALGEGLTLTEVVVTEDALIAYRSAIDLKILSRNNVMLLGISRSGNHFRERIRHITIEPGDLLLLLGQKNQLDDVISWLGCLPVAKREQPVLQRKKASLSAGIFAAAILSSVFDILPLPLALAICVLSYIALGILPASQVYSAVEWPALILLGSLIPIGAALESSGGTMLIADWITDIGDGFSPVFILVLLMIITMILSDFLNNVATALIAAPIGFNIANSLDVNPDSFLIAVAVASSCAFLTPIGHKNNILILGPGGYRFGDFWRIGLPLEILVILVGVPAILFFWPL